jgi:hypothetical protein
MWKFTMYDRHMNKDEKCTHSWGQHIFSILSSLATLIFNYNYYEVLTSAKFFPIQVLGPSENG